jgi:hypothetical protein
MPRPIAAGAMNKCSSQRTSFVHHILALASIILLTGCISSDAPILTDGQPLLGDQPHLQFYTVRDGGAREPATVTFRWRDGRYVPVGGTQKDIGPFTPHVFEGADLLIQSIRPGKPVEYAIARQLAEGTYLLFAVDEADADDATRAKYCNTDHSVACPVTTREAVLAFAHATAAKPHSTGGLAILMGH